MARFGTANPAMKPFDGPQTWDDFHGTEAAVASPRERGLATIGGVAQATGIQLGVALAGALLVWIAFERGIVPPGVSFVAAMGIFGVLFIGGFWLVRRPQAAVVVGPIFSGLYGMLAGAISFMVATVLGSRILANPELVGLSTAELTALSKAELQSLILSQGAGVVFQALLLTIGVVGVLILAVGTGVLRIGNTMGKVIMGAAGAVMFTYVVGWILSIFGTGIPMIHEAGPVGIGFSAVVVVIASLSIAWNLQSIQNGVRGGMPKYMEWYAGYALVSAIIWLYIEILKLLYKIYLMTSRE